MLCLARFPDGTHTVLSVATGKHVKAGDEILPRWVITRVALTEQLVDGQIVQVEVWVEPTGSDSFSGGAAA